MNSLTTQDSHLPWFGDLFTCLTHVQFKCSAAILCYLYKTILWVGGRGMASIIHGVSLFVAGLSPYPPQIVRVHWTLIVSIQLLLVNKLVITILDSQYFTFN